MQPSQTASVNRDYADLRGMLAEQKAVIEELQREQEQLRAQLERLQYGGARPGYAAAGPPTGQAPAGGPPNPWYGVPPAAGTAPGVDGAVDPSTPGSGPAFGTAPAFDPGPAVAGLPTDAPRVPDVGGELPRIPEDLAETGYATATRAFVQGSYDEAVQSYRDFIHKNATSPYADDAQYWIGEAYFRKGQYHRAIIELNQVAISYGSMNRAPAALLRQADAFRIVGDRVDARLSLQKVINRYPDTPEAQRASRMLVELGG